MTPGRIPAAPVVAVLLAHIKQHPEVGSVMDIALRAGIRPDTLEHIARGEREEIGFDMADKLMTNGLRNPGLWYTDALRDIYLGADIAVLDDPTWIPADWKCVRGHDVADAYRSGKIRPEIRCRVCERISKAKYRAKKRAEREAEKAAEAEVAA